MNYFKVNRRNRLLAAIPRFVLLTGITGGVLAYENTLRLRNRDLFTNGSKNSIETVTISSIFGVIISPISLFFTKKKIKVHNLTTQFPVKELEKYSVKWQLENR